MAGAGYDFNWFKQQQEGIQLLSTENAKRANREGLPDRDTDRKVRCRERARRSRYVRETQGFAAYLALLLRDEEYRDTRRRVLFVALPLLVAVLALIVCAYRLWIPISPLRMVDNCDDITLSGRAFAQDLGCTMELTVKNTGEDGYILDKGFVMERRIAGLWRTLPAESAGRTDAAVELAPHETSGVLHYDWTDSYGWLEAGDYRLIVEAENERTGERYPMALEFQIFYVGARN